MNSLDRTRLRQALTDLGLRRTGWSLETGQEFWGSRASGDRTTVTVVWDPMDLLTELEEESRADSAAQRPESGAYAHERHTLERGFLPASCVWCQSTQHHENSCPYVTPEHLSR